MLACMGCGTTKMKTGTEQLLMSDAVDRSISALDFRPAGGQESLSRLRLHSASQRDRFRQL